MPILARFSLKEGGPRVGALAALVVVPCLTLAEAAPRLDCEIQQSGATLRVSATPVADPYVVAPVDINGRFRFKAVLVGSGQKADYVSLYAYDMTSGQPVLLHQAKYRSPLAVRQPAPDALTGRQAVYGAGRGREMLFHCALAEVDE